MNEEKYYPSHSLTTLSQEYFSDEDHLLLWTIPSVLFLSWPTTLTPTSTVEFIYTTTNYFPLQVLFLGFLLRGVRTSKVRANVLKNIIKIIQALYG